jgi:hypothetical protein
MKDVADIVDLLHQERALDDQRRALEVEAAALTRKRDRLRAQIDSVLGGEEVGTVNGEPVVVYQRTEGFAHARFVKAYPDLARTFMRSIVKQELQVDELARRQPELYQEFQVRRWSNQIGDADL